MSSFSSGSTNVRLWLMRETAKARLYSKVPTKSPGRNVEQSDQVWIPKSIVEHTSKVGDEHVVKLPDWFVEKHL